MKLLHSFVTPLRYPGGKGRLGVWLAELIQHNGLENGLYVEPYAGGAGAAMFLLANNHVERIAINDLDPVVHAFWWAVLNDTDRLVELVKETPVTMDVWNEQRNVITDKENKDLTTLGFATFFLNRTNRSGIITGGVIGGKKQDGKYLMDARYNKEDLATRIHNIGKMRDRIQLFNIDAVKLLKHKDLELTNNSLIYLDPPYYEKGSQLYRNHYKPEDHAQIAEAVTVLKTPWLVTYDNCKEIEELYKNESKIEFQLHYSTHLQRPKAKEVMFSGNIDIHTPPSLNGNHQQAIT